ncbi:MAG: glycosyltransferase family 39 protein [Methanoregula sp.]|nr:glycosyltransferase family 39 protein [Methanoregula sp.]
MAKKKTGDKRGTDIAAECDLDDGYVSPITTFRDITFENIGSLVTKSRYVQALIVLTIAGLFLRFYNLGYNSLWLDEAATYNFSVNSFADIWGITAGGEFNPPLFHWAEHIMLMFGNNEVILRFVPALLGVLSIPVFYLVGKEFLDRNTGILAAAACAVSPFLIYYSQEARAYSMMLFFVALATFFFLKAMKSGNRIQWIWFGVFSALAFWTHFYAFVMIAALVLYALIVWAPKIRKEFNNLKLLVLGVIVFVILCLPLILVTIGLFIKRTASAPTFGIQGMTIIPETLRQISGFNELVMILFVVLFAIGIVQAFLIERNKGIFLLVITALTFAISFVLSFKMPMQPRYLIFLSLVFFIGIAISYRTVYSLWGNKAVIYGFIAMFCIVGCAALAASGYYTGYSKDDWRGFSQALAERTSPGDIVVTVPDYMSLPLNYYYSSIKDNTHEYGATTSGDLENVYRERGNNTVFFIVTQDISAANPAGDAVHWLNNNTKYAGQDTGIFLFTSQ